MEEARNRPKVLSAAHVAAAVVLHLMVFLAFCLYATVSFREKEVVIPIDMTVVVNENLDGEENEPPPLNESKPPPEPPEPPAPPKPPPEEEVKDAVVTGVVAKVAKPKKVEPPKPPEKTKAERERERMAEMLKSAKLVKSVKPKENAKSRKTPEEEILSAAKPIAAPVRLSLPNQPSGNGRTGPKTLSDAEIRKLLGSGYRAGTVEQLATSEKQRCVSLIRQAFHAKWELVGRPAWTDTLRTMRLRVQFGSGGVVKEFRLVQGSSDAAADRTVLKAAGLVRSVPGLSPEFLRAEGGVVTVDFKVTPQ